MKKRNNKKILVIINLFSSAKIFIGDQFKYLSKEGYDFHLICSPDEELDFFAKQQGIKYLALPVNRQITIKHDVKTFYQICKYIRKHKFNIIIGHQAKGTLFAHLSSYIFPKLKLVLFCHGTLFETAKGLKHKIFLLAEKITSWKSSKIICVSPYLISLRQKLKIDNKEKQVLLGAGSCGGIDTKESFNPKKINPQTLDDYRNKFGIKNDDFIIGFVGRLVKDKGIIELIQAFNILKKEYSKKSIKLMIVGEPEKRDGLPSEILEILQNSRNIIYTGNIDHARMNYMYACMDCLVLPSHREGFGMCNIEAQAMKIPVITSDYTGCRDTIINCKTGFLTDGQPKDIALKVSQLFDQDLKGQIGESAREWVRNNFDHEIIWPYIKKELDNITQ